MPFVRRELLLPDQAKCKCRSRRRDSPAGVKRCAGDAKPSRRRSLRRAAIDLGSATSHA
jgi:hypothetical protein